MYRDCGSIDNPNFFSRTTPWSDIIKEVAGLSLKGEFSVKTARSHIDDILLPLVRTTTRWVPVIPIKINVFVWKKVARWWELHVADLFIYDDWLTWLSALRLAKDGSIATDLDISLRTDLDSSIGTDLDSSLRTDLDSSFGTDLVSSLRTDLDLFHWNRSSQFFENRSRWLLRNRSSQFSSSRSSMALRTMATTIEQQVALDEALVSSTKRLRIGRSNFRLPSDIQSKESTLQVVYDVLRSCPFFKAFLVTADKNTSVGNNSVFRSFFEKQKLTGPNFMYWYRQLRLVLSTEDKENYLEHPIPAAPIALPGQQVPSEALAAHVAWVKGQKEVVMLMLLTMDLEIQRNLAHLGAYDMLQELKALYSKQAKEELMHTVREFHNCKQEKGQLVSSHVLKMKGYIDNLERLGQPVGFRKTRKINRTKLLKRVMVKERARWAMLQTMRHLLPNLRLIHHLRNITMQRMPFATNVVKLGIGDPVYLTELMKKKKLSQGASTLGDGHRAAVEAIETYHLELPSGLVIVLNNCHYASSITRVAPLPTPIPTMTPSIITTITTASHPPIPPTPIPSEVLQNLPTFDSVFRFDERLKSLEAKFSEYRQTNPFAEAVSNIPGIVHQYMNHQLNKAVRVRSDEQRNLYKALVDAYEADKTILDSYGETAILKRRRKDDDDQEGPSAGSNRGSKRRRKEEPVQTTSQIEEPSHPVFETGAEDQPIVQTSQHLEWFPQQKKPPTPDHDWNKTLPAVQGKLEYHLEEVYKATTDQLDWVNPEGQQYPHNLLQPLPLIPDNRGCRVIPFAHFINNDLEYLRGGASSRKYTASVTKTKAADYGHIKMFTRSIVIQRRVEDLQLRVESYQKRLNLTKLDVYRSDLKRREAYTAYSNPRGFIYQNKDKKNRMQYLPQTIWRKGDKDRATAMIQAIDKMLKTRRIMISLERFVGGRLMVIVYQKDRPSALLDFKSKKWLDAMNLKMQSMKDNDVWVLVELLPNAITIGSKWIFKKKTDMDSAVYIFKARLVAKGFTQTYGVDYEETLSPVANFRATRILIAIVVYYDYEIWKMYVKIAFLNGYLSEEVYMSNLRIL
nr:zinc finger, CCHC-type [Tanacetum cinerariifolium]